MLKIKINTDNAAFDEGDNGLRAETAALLIKIAAKISTGSPLNLCQTIFDSNGNDVGRWRLTDAEGHFRDNDSW